MKIVFSCLPGYGHLYRLLPLALAARDAGHNVLFATAEPLSESLRAFGLEWTLTGMSFDEAFAAGRRGLARGTASPQVRARALQVDVFGGVFPRAVVRDLVPFLVRGEADLIVYDMTNSGASLAARIAGVPGVCHGFGSRLPDMPIVHDIRSRLNTFAAELGLPPTRVPGSGGADLFLDVYPPSLAVPDMPSRSNLSHLRPEPVSESGELPAGLGLGRRRGRPLVYVTMGTAFASVDKLREAIGGLAELAADVLVSTGRRLEPDALGPVPGNVRLERWVPQAKLLPHVDLVVHHGGNGSMLGALFFGLPQLLVPLGADQFRATDAVLRVGAGERLLQDELCREAIAATASRLLNDNSYREAARSIASEIAQMPEPSEVVPLLSALVRSGRR